MAAIHASSLRVAFAILAFALRVPPILGLALLSGGSYRYSAILKPLSQAWASSSPLNV